jgi:ribosomal protein S18 acetylase RimI-like enzyme
MIRRLNSGDAAAFAEIRLEGLRLAPEAFGSDFEKEQVWPLDQFADRLIGSAVFGWEEGGALLGVAGFFALSDLKVRHRGVLWGLYVREAARNRGVGARLVQAVLDHAREQVEQVHLEVAVDNAAAVALYERCGFRRYGTEPRSLKVGDRYLDALLMVHHLTAVGTA